MTKETTAELPVLGGQPPPVAMKSETQHQKDVESDRKAIHAFLDRWEAELRTLRDTLKSDDLKVAGFRNWIAYEFADLRLQRENLT